MTQSHTQTEFKQDFRNAMSSCADSVYVITTNGSAGRYGITMTAVTSITDEPPTVMLAINEKSGIVPIIEMNQQVCINVLAHNQQDLAEHFAGMTKLKADERFDHHTWYESSGGQLHVEGALANLHGKIIATHKIGTHYIFYVEMNEINVNSLEPALVYFRRCFHCIG